jgi:hypothetical protein
LQLVSACAAPSEGSSRKHRILQCRTRLLSDIRRPKRWWPVERSTSTSWVNPRVAAGVLVAEVFTFGDIVERMLEALLVVLVGVSLASYLSVSGIVLGLIVLVIIRPVSVYFSMLGSEATRLRRALIAWFGIRGIGSLYYLAFATPRLPSGARGSSLGALVLSTVAVSVVVHGLTAQSLMSWYERRICKQQRKSAAP